MLKFLIFIFFCFHIPDSSASVNNEEVLMVINDRKITSAEFMRLWNKNKLQSESQSLEDYVELFVNFHLKVAQARDKGIHLEPSFRNELAEYRKHLARPYFGDPETEEKLAREAYERLLYDVNASHILVRLIPGHSPDDTLKAWEKAMQIRRRILEGESFENIARATSDDPSAKTNYGNLGYFTAFHMVYPFENAVYQMEPGELSMPVKTQFGYHIIRLNDIQKSRGEIRTAHIMIGFNQYNEQDAKEKAGDIYKDLTGGSDFEVMAKEYSTDTNTAGQGGGLPWFGSGRIVPEFEKAAFSLENPGDISEPVRTPYGWHIIKLLDQRNIPTFDEIKNELHDRVRTSGDKRSQLIKDALVKRLKKEWEFSENPLSLEVFSHLIDESIFTGNWVVPGYHDLTRVLFSVTGEKVTQGDFAEFISKNAYKRNPWPIDEYVYSLYQEFVKKWLIDYEDSNLENKYPEFRFMMQEYKDGMLLFEITERQIWSNLNDSTGLAEFFRNNIHDYMWGERILASIFTTGDERLAERAARRARRSQWFERRDDAWIIDRLNRRSEKDLVTVEKDILHKGENKVTDKIKWEEEKVSEIYQTNGLYQVVMIHEIIDPEPKSLDEVHEQVLTDYQDYLEEKWIKELREKYNVTVNRDVLSTIN